MTKNNFSNLKCNIKSSLFGLIEGNNTFLEMIDWCAENNFCAIEPMNSLEFTQPNVEAAKKIGDYSKEKNVPISCFSMGARIFSDDPSKEIKRLESYIDTVSALGCPYFHHTILPDLDRNCASIPFDYVLEKIVPIISHLCDYAQEKNVMCLYEDQGFCANGVSRFELLYTGVNHQNMGIVADLGNILFVDQTPEAFVSKFIKHIKHVHVKDYYKKSSDGLYPGKEWYNTLNGNYILDAPIGYGSIDFEAIFKILIQANYDGYYSIESGNYGFITKGLENMNFYYNRSKLH